MKKRTEHARPSAAAVAAAIGFDPDRYRCHYSNDGMRCSSRGSLCESTSGPEKGREDIRRWLCLAHWKLRNDPLGSREVLADLADHPQKPPVNWRDAALQEHGLGILQTAWRDMDEAERRDVIANTIRQAKGFMQRATPPQPTPADADGVWMTPEQRAECERRYHERNAT